ncbi:hypothetical protein LguiB_032903 [Lonicera macranthoides]
MEWALRVYDDPIIGIEDMYFKHYRLHYQPPIHNHGTSAIRNLLSVSHSRCHQALTPNNQLRRDCQEGFS